MSEAKREGPAPTRPDLLARFDALGMSASSFERRFGLPQNFILDARRGRRNGTRAGASWKAFEDGLRVLEGSRTMRPVAPVESSNENWKDALVLASQSADTADKIADLTRDVFELMAKGLIDPNLGRALNDNLSRQQQLLKERRIEEEQARAGEALEVRIVYVNSWRPPEASP